MADLLPVHAIVEGTTIKGYIRTSDVYGESGGVSSKVGIKKVKDTDLTGAEEILPVKEALRTGLISRIGIRYKTSAGKKKSAKLLAKTSTLSGLFGDTAANKLDNVAYNVGGQARGTISTVNIPRRASFYR